MAMTIVSTTRLVTGGVDTHLDVHVAAAVDVNGGVLGVESFATTPTGHAALVVWLASFGVVDARCACHRDRRSDPRPACPRLRRRARTARPPDRTVGESNRSGVTRH